MKINLNNYPGAKGGNGTYQEIINKIPPHKTYIEPFCGSAAIFRRKKPAINNILNDVYSNLIESIIESFVTDELKFVNLDFDGYHYIDDNCRTYNFLTNDYKEIFYKLNYFDDPFFYLDPPYLKSTRKSKADIYEHEWSDQDHIDFLNMVVKVDAKIMISCYDNFIYDLYLDGWNKYSFPSMTRKGIAIETIYYNYPTPEILHDYQYVGDTFTDRQRINRKTKREIKKLEALPPLERNKIIRAVIEKFNYD
jgi:DNA adenine methylase